MHRQAEILQGLCPFMGVEEVEQREPRRDRDDIKFTCCNSEIRM